MAGPWLKMECATPDKPEVLAITATLGWDDPDLTVGKLFKLWRWFDQQTTDGNAARVTPALLDRVVGVSGFVQAVANEGWLTITADGISLSNFDRHNGETAKQRALTAKRVAEHKANAKGNDEGNAGTVTKSVPRGRGREEVNTPQPPQGGEPDGFKTFWTEFPNGVANRKGGRAKCLDLWRRAKLEGEASSIVAHVRAMAASEAWRKQSGEFIPAPLVYLNGRRWDGAETCGESSGLQLAGAI